MSGSAHDLLVHERVARAREVPEHAARRTGLERQDTARLPNLLAAFLRGCDAAPDMVNDALTSAVPVGSQARHDPAVPPAAPSRAAAPGQPALDPEPLPADDTAASEPGGG